MATEDLPPLHELDDLDRAMQRYGRVLEGKEQQEDLAYVPFESEAFRHDERRIVPRPTLIRSNTEGNVNVGQQENEEDALTNLERNARMRPTDGADGDDGPGEE